MSTKGEGKVVIGMFLERQIVGKHNGVDDLLSKGAIFFYKLQLTYKRTLGTQLLSAYGDLKFKLYF